MKKAVIEIDRLFFSYQDIPVLANISFSIHEGEFIGLIGPNGGGKTTLLRLIMGFLKPSQGTISIFDTSTDSSTSQRHMAYVPQANRFDKDFPISVLDVVLSGLLFKLPWHGLFSKNDRYRALEQLESMHLSHLANHAFGSLSGGQAQRVLIARALVSQPKLLLLDEPTASVDSQAEATIYDVLDAHKGKMTILMVTHNLRSAINQVDRLYCVQRNVTPLNPEEVCEHVVKGLYHTPLTQSSSQRLL